MADRATEMELDCHIAWDDDYFESYSNESVSSIDDKQESSDTKGTQRTSGDVDNAEKLSDSQVLEAVNTLLKVYLYHILPFSNFHVPWLITRFNSEFSEAEIEAFYFHRRYGLLFCVRVRVGTCEASRFDSNSNRTFRFDSIRK